MSGSDVPHHAVNAAVHHLFVEAQLTCFAVRVVICCCTKLRMLERRCDKLSTPAQPHITLAVS